MNSRNRIDFLQNQGSIVNPNNTIVNNSTRPEIYLRPQFNANSINIQPSSLNQYILSRQRFNQIEPQIHNSALFQSKKTNLFYNKLIATPFTDISQISCQTNLNNLSRMQTTKHVNNSAYNFIYNAGQDHATSNTSNPDLKLSKFISLSKPSNFTSYVRLSTPSNTSFRNQRFTSSTVTSLDFRIPSVNTPLHRIQSIQSTFLPISTSVNSNRRLDHASTSMTAFQNYNSPHVFVPLMSTDSKPNQLNQNLRFRLPSDRSIIQAMPLPNSPAVNYIDSKVKPGPTFIPSLSYNVSFVTSTTVSQLPINKEHSPLYSKQLVSINHFPSLFKNYCSSTLPVNIVSSSNLSTSINSVTEVVSSVPSSKLFKLDSSMSQQVSMVAQHNLMKSPDSISCHSIDVPFQWKRNLENGLIVYYSPSGVQLKSISCIKQYLTTEGTCKCGLQCPLQVEKIFSFDVNILSHHKDVEEFLKEEASAATMANSTSLSLCDHIRKAVAVAAFRKQITAAHSSNYADNKDDYDSESTKSALSGDEEEQLTNIKSKMPVSKEFDSKNNLNFKDNFYQNLLDKKISNTERLSPNLNERIKKKKVPTATLR